MDLGRTIKETRYEASQVTSSFVGGLTWQTIIMKWFAYCDDTWLELVLTFTKAFRSSMVSRTNSLILIAMFNHLMDNLPFKYLGLSIRRRTLREFLDFLSSILVTISSSQIPHRNLFNLVTVTDCQQVLLIKIGQQLLSSLA